MAASTPLASSRLRRLAQAPEVPPPEAVEEQCDLCGAPIGPEHRHLVDLEKSALLCACQACKILFDRGAAGGGHFRLVPDRRLRLDDLRLDDPTWERLRIPVDMAFFFSSSRAGRVLAFYPSPMGPTESLLELDSWARLEGDNPVLATLEPDVEALLVNRARGARRHWLVPIDDCYALVGLIRTTWRGLTGGKDVWLAIEAFFAGLDERSRPASRDDGNQEAT
jgi:hypothetical protein